MRQRGWRVPTLLVASLVATPLVAQAPADRAAIDAFRDSLIAGSTAGTSELARSATPLSRLRAGYTRLATGVASSDTALILASLEQFYEATVARPTWPYGWYGRGEAKLALFRLASPEVRSP